VNDTHTQPLQSLTLPVRALRVEVLDGPQSGETVNVTSEKLTVGTAEGNDLRLSDPTVSRYHLELARGPQGTAIVDHGSTNGTFVGNVRIFRAAASPGTVLRVGETRLRVLDGEDVAVALRPEPRFGGLLGASAVMRRLMAKLERAAQGDAAALLLGESGTGKELIARALHETGPRKDKPFITVDCAALTPTLVASELFGHERGAFTGADRAHAGTFERANTGTIFLDEIGEVSAPLQAMLLGVLERRRFRRLGGNADFSTDVRVISATNRDLRAEINAGRFRLDLFYRLAVVTLDIPPLRERPDDIPLLMEQFLRECGADQPLDAMISPSTLDYLKQYSWPGNVRELRNFVEATFLMGEMPSVSGEGSSAPAPAVPAPTELTDGLLEDDYRTARLKLLEAFERKYLPRLLERAAGNVTQAAKMARMDRSYLTQLLSRHGLARSR
jgi:DNA-binding NtrC family response regulator